LGKILQGPKVSRCRGKVLQGLHIRHALDGSVESNMEPTLGQSREYANAINKTHNGNILRCEFKDPRQGKLDGFSYLESLKKCKRRLHWGTFFEGSLVGSKRGKLAPTRHLFKSILTSVIHTRSLDHFFIFKESEKILTMDSVKNVLLDHFNECERIRSLDDLFNFRESEKSLTMDSVRVPFRTFSPSGPKKG
jgi:hypothetical protein